MDSKKRGKKPLPPKASSDPDDWSDPSKHPQLHVALPGVIFAVLLVIMIVYGFLTS